MAFRVTWPLEVDDPAGTKMLAGETVTTEVLLLESEMMMPPDGAGVPKLIANWSELFCRMV